MGRLVLVALETKPEFCPLPRCNPPSGMSPMIFIWFGSTSFPLRSGDFCLISFWLESGSLFDLPDFEGEIDVSISKCLSVLSSIYDGLTGVITFDFLKFKTDFVFLADKISFNIV